MKAIDAQELLKYRRRFQKLWESILQHRAEASIVVGNAGDKETATLLQCEVDGGHCARCGDPWREIRFDNTFAQGRYFEPGCRCYPKCPRCQAWQYEEWSAGILKSRDWKCECGFQLLTDAGLQRYGRDYEAAWVRMTRYQQHVEAARGGAEQGSQEKRATQTAKSHRRAP